MNPNTASDPSLLLTNCSPLPEFPSARKLAGQTRRLVFILPCYEAAIRPE
uniref:Uncharacterized protein n=1 Tax=Anguilla anguilla TaxID=7936 RepID=A0A0E9TJU2_ANGAN